MKKIFKKLTAIMAAVVISVAASLGAGASTPTTFEYSLHNTPGAPSSANLVKASTVGGLKTKGYMTVTNDMTRISGTATVKGEALTKTGYVTVLSFTQTTTGRKSDTKYNAIISDIMVGRVTVSINISSNSYTAASGECIFY